MMLANDPKHVQAQRAAANIIAQLLEAQHGVAPVMAAAPVVAAADVAPVGAVVAVPGVAPVVAVVAVSGVAPVVAVAAQSLMPQILRFLFVLVPVLLLLLSVSDPNSSQSLRSSLHDTYHPSFHDITPCDDFFRVSIDEAPEDFLFNHRHHACFENLQDKDPNKYSMLLNLYSRMKMEVERQRLSSFKHECTVVGTLLVSEVCSKLDGYEDIAKQSARQTASEESMVPEKIESTLSFLYRKTLFHFDRDLHFAVIMTMLVAFILAERSIHRMLRQGMSTLNLCILLVVGLQRVEDDDWYYAMSNLFALFIFQQCFCTVFPDREP